MSLPVVLRDEAQIEFDEAFDYYDGQQVFDRISANPLLHAVVVGDVRKAVVTRFPYCVFYRPHADRVEILAVFQTSRNPAIWQGRV